MGPGDLSRALAPLPRYHDPRLIVGHDTFDDAGVFVVRDDLALVQTVDFFAPIVDDPYTFGRVAATNALSDIYAMGGSPITALNIVAFPTGQLPLDVLTEILRGGADTVHAAGAHIVGGHTITDDELKYGLAVTGTAHPARLLTNAAARPGDRLVLTKPLGTGILATAIKQRGVAFEPSTHDAEPFDVEPGAALPPAVAAHLIESMTTLNRAASEAALALGVRAATDVTGFGLLGHASHIARASGVTLRIRLDTVPELPGARKAWAAGARTAGAERNSAFVDGMTDWGSTDEATRAMLVDPQTSGGLLLAVPPTAVAEYLSRVPGSLEIGDVVPRRIRELELL